MQTQPNLIFPTTAFSWLYLWFLMCVHMEKYFVGEEGGYHTLYHSRTSMMQTKEHWFGK
jgi:hypothetical protein